MQRIIYFGPPGTGKTTTLLEMLDKELQAGMPAEEIAFLTFTRRARFEAVERVGKVLNIKPKDLPHFRTIHSMAFKALKLRDGDVLTFKHLAAFGTGMGLTFGRTGVSELASEGLNSQSRGDQMLAIDNLSRLRGEPIRKTWNEANCGVDWQTFDHFARSYALYKKETGLFDFTDVLTQFVKSEIRLPVKVAFIDEAQDLSALQWYAALQAVERAQRQYVAGDDDQAIYRWAGADVATFLSIPGERRVLAHSYRLPLTVYTLAGNIVRRVKQRVAKNFTARDARGRVLVHNNAQSLKVGEGKWLWLVRNRYLLPSLQERLATEGIVYSQHGTNSIVPSEMAAIYDWERLRAGAPLPAHRVRDVYSFLRSGTQLIRGFKLLPNVNEKAHFTADGLRTRHGLLATGVWYEVLLDIPDWRRAYYRKLLRDRGTLKLEAQVQLETIHGAKGAEAPNVALFLEQSRRVYDEAQSSAARADDEHRVFYVGATRAKEELHLIVPSTRWGYTMPGM